MNNQIDEIKEKVWPGIKKDYSTKFFYLLIFIDTFYLLLEYNWFFSDEGVWPLSYAVRNNYWLETLGTAFSWPWQFTPLLFILTFALLIYGFVRDAKAWTSLSLAIALIFIQRRSAWILDAGDFFIIIFLVWHSLFKLTPERFKHQIRYAFALQLMLVYVENALLKKGPTWNEWGTALNIIWGQSYISYAWITNLVNGVDLKWLTIGARTVELCLPLLLLFRIYRPIGYFFILYHLAIAATIKIGLFSWINIAGWLFLLVPPESSRTELNARKTHWIPVLSFLWLFSSYLQGLNFTYLHKRLGLEMQNWLLSTYVAQRWGMFCPDPRFTSYEYKFVCMKKNSIVPCSPETNEWTDTENWGRRRKQYMIKLAEKKNGFFLHQSFQKFLCRTNPQADDIKVNLKAHIKDLQFPNKIKVEERPWIAETQCP